MTAVTWPAYDSYNCDESLWLRNVPVDWSSMRLQHIATCNDNTLREFSYRDREIDYVDISSVDADSNTYTVQTMDFRNAPSRARRLAHHGDIVFSTVRPYLKAVATVANPNDKLVFSTGFAVIRPQPTVDPGFLGYVLRDHDFSAEVNMRSVGASYPAINVSDLLKLKVPFPPLTEQRIISAFLDEKCAKVDEAVRIKEEQIALLRERRQILIQEAVTRGLNPNVPMKDTGVQWVGRVPEHWQIWKLAHAFPKLGSGTTPDTGQASFYDGGIAWLQTGDLNDGAATTTAKTVSKLAVRHYPTLKVYPPNSVVMAMYGATIGKLGILQIAAATNQACCVLPKSQIVTPEFAFFCLLAMRPYILSEAYGGGQPNISQNTVKNFRLPVPSVGEQREITTFLDCESERIDKALRIKLAQITAIKEYKATLINAAVTGKIKVA